MKTENELFEYVSETERLVVRPLKKADYENWLNEFNRRYPSQYRHDTGRTDMSDCTEEWFNNLIDKHQNLALTDTAYIFGVFRQEDGTHVGMVDLSTIERGEFQWGRIGYSFHNQYWGKGYGKEAVNEVLHVAFKHLNFHRIEAHSNIDNPSSIKLAENVGMEYECTRKGFIFEFGEWTDNLIYFKNLVE